MSLNLTPPCRASREHDIPLPDARRAVRRNLTGATQETVHRTGVAAGPQLGGECAASPVQADMQSTYLDAKLSRHELPPLPCEIDTVQELRLIGPKLAQDGQQAGARRILDRSRGFLDRQITRANLIDGTLRTARNLARVIGQRRRQHPSEPPMDPHGLLHVAQPFECAQREALQQVVGYGPVAPHAAQHDAAPSFLRFCDHIHHSVAARIHGLPLWSRINNLAPPFRLPRACPFGTH